MKKPELLIIPNDLLSAYDKKGYSRIERSKYYNPNNEFDVTILGVEEKDRAPFNFSGFDVYPSDRNLKDIDFVMNKIKPDLVRAYNGTWGAELVGEIGKRYSIPSVTSVHNLMPEVYVNNVDRVFCVSEHIKRKCLDYCTKDKLKVINDGVDLEIFKDLRGTEEVLDLDNKYPGKYKILSVGRLVWQKNLENLIEATKVVRKKLGNITHIHIGKFGEFKDKIEHLTKDFDLGEFHLISNKDQHSLSSFYSWADAFTMTSISEGFGIVYTEALACGTPIVTSNLPPMTEYTVAGYNGILANPNSPEDTAEKIINVLTDKTLYRELKQNARKSVEKFNIKDLKRQEARFYKEMLR